MPAIAVILCVCLCVGGMPRSLPMASAHGLSHQHANYEQSSHSQPQPQQQQQRQQHDYLLMQQPAMSHHARHQHQHQHHQQQQHQKQPQQQHNNIGNESDNKFVAATTKTSTHKLQQQQHDQQHKEQQLQQHHYHHQHQHQEYSTPTAEPQAAATQTKEQQHHQQHHHHSHPNTHNHYHHQHVAPHRNERPHEEPAMPTAEPFRLSVNIGGGLTMAHQSATLQPPTSSSRATHAHHHHHHHHHQQQQQHQEHQEEELDEFDHSLALSSSALNTPRPPEPRPPAARGVTTNTKGGWPKSMSDAIFERNFKVTLHSRLADGLPTYQSGPKPSDYPVGGAGADADARARAPQVRGLKHGLAGKSLNYIDDYEDGDGDGDGDDADTDDDAEEYDGENYDDEEPRIPAQTSTATTNKRYYNGTEDRDQADAAYARVTRDHRYLNRLEYDERSGQEDYADDEPYRNSAELLQNDAPPGVLTDQKFQELGNREAVQQARDKYKQEHKSPAELAVEHINRFRFATKCSRPLPRVVNISNETSKRYVPHCTILHRCGEDSGCCESSAKICVAKSFEYVQLYFFVIRINSGPYIRETETRMLRNDTECHCVNRSEYYTRRDKRSERHHHAHSPAQSQSQLQLQHLALEQPAAGVCNCPKHFEKFMEDGDSEHGEYGVVCRCDCSSSSASCQRLKSGAEGFAMNDRKCIAERRCQPPTCVHGTYNIPIGRCPALRYDYGYG